MLFYAGRRNVVLTRRPMTASTSLPTCSRGEIPQGCQPTASVHKTPGGSNQDMVDPLSALPSQTCLKPIMVDLSGPGDHMARWSVRCLTRLEPTSTSANPWAGKGPPPEATNAISVRSPGFSNFESMCGRARVSKRRFLTMFHDHNL